jgi:hypothetical protein
LILRPRRRPAEFVADVFVAHVFVAYVFVAYVFVASVKDRLTRR